MENYIAYLTSQKDFAEKKYRFLRYALLTDTPCEDDAEYWKNRLSFFNECLIDAQVAHEVSHNTSPPVQAVQEILNEFRSTIKDNRVKANKSNVQGGVPENERKMYFMGANNALFQAIETIESKLWFSLPITHDEVAND